ncbi:protein SEMI-ROLLED LEAF 2-like [Salvia hispanica]|uniref:protein SEMI-ROLLED LEAF 2-like n=1 Tax=Salvia hispanica TaxID=49212 RepID=UPI0020095AC3|nr:protein SEMI-ROLLED LEAF 2-like [Salvia hispanica]
MTVVSGVISRQVLPACDNLCFFCPALRTRSRQPVKRYKHLISDIFPRSQDEEVNERKIGKLCDYASKNPLRIPKIADSLEQKFYKELRNENYRFVKIVMLIYRKLLLSCKDQIRTVLPLSMYTIYVAQHPGEPMLLLVHLKHQPPTIFVSRASKVLLTEKCSSRPHRNTSDIPGLSTHRCGGTHPTCPPRLHRPTA